jgi:hypothetical protein
MMIQIKKINGELIHEGDYNELKNAVEFCVLNGISLQGAYLQGAYLRGADLQRANLQEADLQRANLREVNLRGANLRGANLREANLRGANLQEVNLRGANLRGANLREANLREANLQEVKYSIINVLRSNFNSLSDELTLELMRWDCVSCGEEKMKIWIDTDTCPFADSEREFYFQEKKKLWVPGKPTMNYKELFIALCKEKEIKI